MTAAVLGDLDRQILHALYVDGRAPFRRVAEVLSTSEQTVARRYRRFREDGIARVVAQLASDRLEQSDWLLRLRVLSGADDLTAALAARSDTAWVELASVGTEVFCVVRAQQDPDTTRLAVRELPTSPGIIGIETYQVLHLFVNGSKPPVSIAAALSPEQVEQLRPFPPEPTNGRSFMGLRADDWPLVQALIDDGRATYRQLAERTHWHESTVRGRIEELLHAQVLYFDLDVNNDALGLTTRAVLWLSVTPARLTDVGNALAEHPEVPIVAATTGATNLLASVVCDNDRALYEYLTQRVAKVKGVTSIETVPVIKSVKHHVTVRQAITDSAEHPLPGTR